MSGDRGLGVSVEVDTVLARLEPTRALRQALDVLFGHLTPDMKTDAVKNALNELDTRLRKTELAALRAWDSRWTTSSSLPSAR